MTHAWTDMDTAPKGSGLDGPPHVNHPDYVEPPDVLLHLSNGQQVVAYWDWYYAAGGRGDGNGQAWVVRGGDRVRDLGAEPTHWMPLFDPPPV